MRIDLPAGGAKTVRSDDLESGAAGFSGSLGDGTGKWRLDVESNQPIIVLNLMSTPTGHITNLSAPPVEGVEVEAEAVDDHGDDADAATRVRIPSETPGEFEEAGDRDWFRIEVPSAMRLSVSTTGSADTVGRLHDANDSLLTSNDDGGPGSNFLIERDVTRGTYYVEVGEFLDNDTGSYRLHVRRAADAPDPTGPLAAPTVTILDSDSFEIRWEWNLSRGASYAFDWRFRVRLPDGQRSNWEDGCDVWRDAPGTGSGSIWKSINDLTVRGAPPPSGTVVEARYRYRGGASCFTGTPGDWSPSGEATF